MSALGVLVSGGRVLGLTRQTGVKLAEVGFLLILIAGVWLFAAEVQERFSKMRMIVSGLLLAAAGVLLIVATHWGQFG